MDEIETAGSYIPESLNEDDEGIRRLISSCKNRPFSKQIRTLPINSTSTIHADETPGNLDVDKLLLCIAAVIQTQVCEAASHASKSDTTSKTSLEVNFKKFEVMTTLSAGFGGIVRSTRTTPFVSATHFINSSSDSSSLFDLTNSDLAVNEAWDDDLLRELIANGKVPAMNTILRFVTWIYQSAQYSAQCNVMALIYINRLAKRDHLKMTMLSWRTYWLVAVIVAQKVFDDSPKRTSCFAALLPPITKEELRDLEWEMCRLLDWKTGVKPSLYSTVYFELRQLFFDIMGDRALWLGPCKPLSIDTSRRFWDTYQKKLCPDKPNRSVRGVSSIPRGGAKTMEDLTCFDKSRFVIS